MPEPPPVVPQSPGPPVPSRDISIAARIVAAIEVLLCSDFLTQLALGGTLKAFGVSSQVNGHLNTGFVVALSLGDAVLLVMLILLMLYAHGESPRDVFLGRRPVAPEIVFGIPLIFVALGIALSVLLLVRRLAPSLHTVPENPLQDLLRSPRDAWWFALVVLVAGGVREEIQRGFVLRRFEQYLGGGGAGILIFSALFGLGHVEQGYDVALATAVLGAFWGAVYLRRRTVLPAMIGHAGFNLAQVIKFIALGAG